MMTPEKRRPLTRILPGVGREDLEREVQEILAGHKEAAHSAG